MVAIGVWLGWLVHGSARIHARCRRGDRDAGGQIAYDWQWNNETDIGGQPRAPQWLVGIDGGDLFDTVTSVVLPEATDETIIPIERLTRVQRLNLFHSSVSDAGLVHLNGLTDATTLDLSVLRSPTREWLTSSG